MSNPPSCNELLKCTFVISSFCFLMLLTISRILWVYADRDASWGRFSNSVTYVGRKEAQCKPSNTRLVHWATCQKTTWCAGKWTHSCVSMTLTTVTCELKISWKFKRNVSSVHYQLFVHFFLLLGLLCGHTDFVVQRLDFGQLSGRLQLRRASRINTCFYGNK